jgi:hypothetical protein
MSTQIDDIYFGKKPASEKADCSIKESRSLSPIRKENRCSINSNGTPETGLSGTSPAEQTTNEQGMTFSEDRSDKIFDSSSSSQKGFKTALLLTLDE